MSEIFKYHHIDR